ncbi:hypothetical protein J421_3970 [Gemmatirosa kalamazoonensis]|uniref:DUF4440 domain-containing protein n=1 Tax=Gemmatirosa kalamazoonensis TaxID=861299 RepID=W0RM20_9BACT|nr:SgcJ/EcaC family oxidoreductase [Gemmatirosa kalamazoonensis]AHG91507.1 hypothetical protein J421_3970 [Gemmatirosa kalamazoonensis]
MRRCTVALALLAVAACSPKADEKVDSTTAAAAVAAPNVANTKADEDSIRAISDRIGAAMSAHDTAAVRALYADDGVDFTPGMAPARGSAALVKEYGDMFGGMKGLKATLAPADVIVSQSGDLAVSRSRYQLSWTDAKGKPASDHGNVVVAWKKVNGQWKIATSINASEVPMPGM